MAVDHECDWQLYYEHQPTGAVTNLAKCHDEFMVEIQTFLVLECKTCGNKQGRLETPFWICEECGHMFDGTIPNPDLLRDTVDKIFVINLEHRRDRWYHFKHQMREIKHEDYERFDAYGVNHLPPERYYRDIPDFKMSGWWGNKFSHYGVIDEAKKRGYDSVLVLEDDVEFHPQFLNILYMALSQLKDRQWDWLHFGGNYIYVPWQPRINDKLVRCSPIDNQPYAYVPSGISRVAPNLAKIHRMLTAHAYIVKREVYDFILEHAIQSPLSIDGFYAYEVHSRFRCFCLCPCAARQIPGKNDIDGTKTDYASVIHD